MSKTYYVKRLVSNNALQPTNSLKSPLVESEADGKKEAWFLLLVDKYKDNEGEITAEVSFSKHSPSESINTDHYLLNTIYAITNQKQKTCCCFTTMARQLTTPDENEIDPEILGHIDFTVNESYAPQNISFSKQNKTLAPRSTAA